MANLSALEQFLSSLRGDSLFGAGIMGTTSYQQNQTDALKRAFGQMQTQPNDKKSKSDFHGALLAAHTVSVITDKELKKCEQWLEEK